MRLRAEQLANHLAKDLLPIYIVSGDETLLVQECCDAIRAKCKQLQFSEREVLHVEPGFDWQQLLSSANTLSLFAERKLIELRLPTGKPGDAGSKVLTQYANAPAEDNVLLIICNKLESASTRSKWYKTIEQAGAGIQVWPITAAQLPRWMGQRLQQAGLKASPEAIQLLSSRVEGNLLAAAQEIDKLQLYCDQNTIDVDAVLSAVADNARYDVFGLVDRALQGDAQGSLKMVQGLKAEGTQLPVILWAISRELRTLCLCAEHIEQGNGIERVLQNQRVWDKRKPLTKAALRRLSATQLRRLIVQASQIDQSVKGMNPHNSWDLLQELVIRLAGAKLPSIC